MTRGLRSPSPLEARKKRGDKVIRPFKTAQEAQQAMDKCETEYKKRSRKRSGFEFAMRGVDAASSLAAEGGMESVFNMTRGSTAAAEEIPSMLPDCFGARTVQTAFGTLGYIRIYSFMVYDANAFVAEFARLAQAISQNGLIIDVAKNGGGNIIAGEKVLQVLSQKDIDVERFHLINTPTTIELCDSFALNQWKTSVQMAIATGEIYSQGFPLTKFGPQDVTYRYPGKKVLIIDALCYSTTDIFAAGFQDNKVGKILGTSGRTGRGGCQCLDVRVFPSFTWLHGHAAAGQRGFSARQYGDRRALAIKLASRWKT